MGYVAVRGGGLAIEESLKLLERERVEGSDGVSADAVEDAFPGLVEQVMGEASLYAPRLAAVALKQAQGSPEEAVFLLRAFRSTLERPYVSREIKGENMAVECRISAAFKDVLGGQLLGATRDYSHRLIRFDLEHETNEDAAKVRRAYDDELDAEWASCGARSYRSGFGRPSAFLHSAAGVFAAVNGPLRPVALLLAPHRLITQCKEKCIYGSKFACDSRR